MNKKAKLNGIWIAAIVVVAAVVCVGIVGHINGWFERETTPPPGEGVKPTYKYVNNPTQPNVQPVQYQQQITDDDGSVPVQNVSGSFKDKFTQAAVTDGYFRFYVPGADVSDPYVQPIDSIDVSAGSNGNLILQTNTQYDVYYESDGATYYDDELNEWQVNYNPETGKGYLLINGVAYHGVSDVGTFPAVDSLAEVQSGVDETGQDTDYNNITLLNGTAVTFGDTDATTCSVNNVINATGSNIVTDSNYTISACTITLKNTVNFTLNAWNNSLVTVNYTKTRTDLLRYDESSLGGSGWWKMDIGNNDANSELRGVVMCFRDNDGDMEGTEVTAFTAAFVSGSSTITIPGTLQQFWEDAMGGGGAECVDIAATLGGSQKARWILTMTVDESAWDESYGSTEEEFEITFDDLGNYLQKQYPSRNAKATSVTLTIGNRA